MLSENYHNDIRIFAGNSHPQLAKDICNHLGLPLGKLQIEYFSNTESRIKLGESVRGKHIFFIQTGCAGKDEDGNDLRINDNVFDTLLFMDTCRKSSCESVTLIVPCYPYARQDKKDSPR